MQTQCALILSCFWRHLYLRLSCKHPCRRMKLLSSRAVPNTTCLYCTIKRHALSAHRATPRLSRSGSRRSFRPSSLMFYTPRAFYGAALTHGSARSANVELSLLMACDHRRLLPRPLRQVRMLRCCHTQDAQHLRLTRGPPDLPRPACRHARISNTSPWRRRSRRRRRLRCRRPPLLLSHLYHHQALSSMHASSIQK